MPLAEIHGGNQGTIGNLDISEGVGCCENCIVTPPPPTTPHPEHIISLKTLHLGIYNVKVNIYLGGGGGGGDGLQSHYHSLSSYY